jgi:enoyl-CoA hydratase/carnithine racemase
MSDRVVVSIDAHVAEVTLNRPDKHNAIDIPMFEALAAAGEQLANNRSVRAVVLTGAGVNFCSGLDVSIFRQEGAVASAARMAPGDTSPANFFQRPAYTWRELPVPVICAVQGIAFGGGLQIALGADIRFAAADARLSVMEIKWGLIPDMAISTTLRNILPVDKAKELVFSGRIVDAVEAEQLGLVTALRDDPLTAARDLARSIAGRSPDAIRAAKAMINGAWLLPEADALRREAELQMAVFGSANQSEAILANLEKRAPIFTDPKE